MKIQALRALGNASLITAAGSLYHQFPIVAGAATVLGLGMHTAAIRLAHKQRSVNISETFIVGGWVRDTVMDLEPNDTDYVVTGATEEIMLEAGFTRVGESFPVFLHPESGDEYALARTEKSTGKGYTDFELDFNPEVTIEEDLYRRDFTINAMAWGVGGLRDGKIIDPYGGAEDIEDKLIRAVNPKAFSDDPVRVFRGCRFAARFYFGIEQETAQAIRRCIESGAMEHMTKERVWLEIKKGMEHNYVHFLDHLDNFGLLARFGINPNWDVLEYLVDKEYDTEWLLYAGTMLGGTLDDIAKSTKKIAVPSEHQKFAKTSLMLYNELPVAIQEQKLPEFIYKMFTVFKDPTYIVGFRLMMNALGLLSDDDGYWDNMFEAYNSVQAKDFDLPEGKELGQAIKQGRIEAIRGIE